MTEHPYIPIPQGEQEARPRTYEPNRQQDLHEGHVEEDWLRAEEGFRPEAENREKPSTPLAAILAVSYDSDLLASRKAILLAAGYAVETALTLEEAITRFEAREFDLVLLCHSITPQDRARIMICIRNTSSVLPVVLVAPPPHPVPDRLVDATIESTPDELLCGILGVLEQAQLDLICGDGQVAVRDPCERPCRSGNLIAGRLRPRSLALPPEMNAPRSVRSRDQGIRNKRDKT